MSEQVPKQVIDERKMRTWDVILHEHVGRLRQLVQNLDALGMLKGEADGFLIAIHLQRL